MTRWEQGDLFMISSAIKLRLMSRLWAPKERPAWAQIEDYLGRTLTGQPMDEFIRWRLCVDLSRSLKERYG